VHGVESTPQRLVQLLAVIVREGKRAAAKPNFLARIDRFVLGNKDVVQVLLIANLRRVNGVLRSDANDVALLVGKVVVTVEDAIHVFEDRGVHALRAHHPFAHQQILEIVVRETDFAIDRRDEVARVAAVFEREPQDAVIDDGLVEHGRDVLKHIERVVLGPTTVQIVVSRQQKQGIFGKVVFEKIVKALLQAGIDLRIFVDGVVHVAENSERGVRRMLHLVRDVAQDGEDRFLGALGKV